MIKKLKIGMITVHPHGQPWSEVLKGNEDAEITHVWDYNFGEAAKLADRYGFRNVCTLPEEMIGKIDAVLIPGGRTLPMGATDSMWSQTEPMGMQPSQHLELARPFLEAGIPVLIDKPLADSMQEAEEIIAAARRGKSLLMSCSALRYDPQLLAAKESIRCGGIGPVRAANIILGTGPTDLTWYIIHSIEVIATLFGTEVESVTAATGNTSIVLGGHFLPHATSFILKYRSGPLVSLMMLREKAKREDTEKLWPLDYIPSAYLTLYSQYYIFGDLDYLDIRVVGKAYYLAMVRTFIESVKSGIQPIPFEEMLEINRLLLSLPEAVRSGQTINPQTIH